MSLAANKIIITGGANVANAYTNATGAFFQIYAAGNATVTPPAGFYYINNIANVTVELNYADANANASNTAYTVVLANNTAGFFMADGVNVRCNVLGGAPTITLYAVNGGAPVSGTFNK